MADEGRNRDDEDTRLLEQIEMRLARIVEQNDEIIKLLTPPPSDDITNLGGTISTPVKK